MDTVARAAVPYLLEQRLIGCDWLVQGSLATTKTMTMSNAVCHQLHPAWFSRYFRVEPRGVVDCLWHREKPGRFAGLGWAPKA